MQLRSNLEEGIVDDGKDIDIGRGVELGKVVDGLRLHTFG